MNHHTPLLSASLCKLHKDPLLLLLLLLLLSRFSCARLYVTP